MSAPLTRTQRLVVGIALLMVCASLIGASSGLGSPTADNEHRWQMSNTITLTVFYRTLNVERLEIFYREAGRKGGSPTMAYS
jgi:hypothetical protein